MASYKYGFQVADTHNVCFHEEKGGLSLDLRKYDAHGKLSVDAGFIPLVLSRWRAIEVEDDGTDWLISIVDTPNIDDYNYLGRIQITVPSATGCLPDIRLTDRMVDRGDLPEGPMRIIGLDDVRPSATPQRDSLIFGFNANSGTRLALRVVEEDNVKYLVFASIDLKSIGFYRGFDQYRRTGIIWPHS